MYENPIPVEIFILPVRTNAGDLKDKNAVVVEEVVDLPKESLVPANSDVLGEGLVNSPGKKGSIHLPQPSRD